VVELTALLILCKALGLKTMLDLSKTLSKGNGKKKTPATDEE
jgi:hypothetical protein